jgi:hypothetical protein
MTVCLFLIVLLYGIHVLRKRKEGWLGAKSVDDAIARNGVLNLESS